MKIINYIFLFLPFISFAQNEIIGNYNYKLSYNTTDIFSDFNLKVKADSTFIISKYEYQICYDYTDTLKGKWKIINKKLSFYDIEQPKYISKSNSNLNDDEILINEKCVFSYMNKDSIGIKLLALDSNLKYLNYLSPKEYYYENETVITKFKIPKNTYQIIYFNGNSKPLNNYFYGGINLVGFNKNNTFEISNCGKTKDKPVKFLNPYEDLPVCKLPLIRTV
tara:strand:- start:16 stop:681 length:666 start_codon:yes stop_codon:yes gene_type:complete